MAGLLNPQYGLVPGAPYGLHEWLGNQFVLANMLPPPPPPPPPPLAPAITPQDIETHQAATALAGSAPGGGDNGAGGLERGAGFADPTRGLASGQPNTPANFSSNIGPWAGNIGGAVGLGLGIPGLGIASGALGQMADANRYAGVLNANSVPFSPNYAQAALYGASALPFGLGSVFGESARSQSEAARRDALANGIIEGNTSLPPGPIAPAEERSFFTDLFGGGGSGNDMSGPGGSFGVGEGGFGPAAGGMSGAEGGLFGWAKGGMIPHPMPGMMDPPGPDDQVGALQSGEGVLTKAAMKRHPGLLDALNKGDIKRARGLLGK